MKNKKAFTLIELLVVIAIIGLLATISVIALNNARAKSRDAKRVADIKQVQTALELYFNDENHYPSNAEFASGSIDSTSTNGTTTYMAQIPLAPTPSDGGCSDAHNTYVYSQLQGGNSYRITFCLGGQTGSLAAGYTLADPSGFSAFTANIVCNDIHQECDPSCPIGSTCGGGTLVSASPNIVAAPSMNSESGCVGTQDCTGKIDADIRVWGPDSASNATSYGDGVANVAAA